MIVFAGRVNQQQQAAINYLKTENEILKSQLEGRRLRLKDKIGGAWRRRVECSAGSCWLRSRAS